VNVYGTPTRSVVRARGVQADEIGAEPAGEVEPEHLLGQELFAPLGLRRLRCLTDAAVGVLEVRAPDVSAVDEAAPRPGGQLVGVIVPALGAPCLRGGESVPLVVSRASGYDQCCSSTLPCGTRRPAPVTRKPAGSVSADNSNQPDAPPTVTVTL